MQNQERRRLLDLAKEAPEAAKAIYAKLAADPATYTASVRFTVRDPYLELGDAPGELDINSILAESVTPEWFRGTWGAGWYVTHANTSTRSGQVEPIDSTFLDGDGVLAQVNETDKVVYKRQMEAIRKVVERGVEIVGARTGEADSALSDMYGSLMDILDHPDGEMTL